MPSDQEKDKGRKIGGGYTVLGRLGSGGFAEVWRGEAPGGFPVAVKIMLRPADDEQTKQELASLELIKRLSHPYLLRTHASYMIEDRLYIIMELAEGTLRDRLKECRAEGKTGIPLEELLVYFREAAEALDYLHTEHVLHRDIKPENILLHKRHAKVADFGLARGYANSQQMMSATGSGTPRYMAPEVWQGKVNHQSDIYSLALTYYELRLDRWPFPSGDMLGMMMDHLKTPPDVAMLPYPEQQVLLKALAKEPTERYATCCAFVAALDEIVQVSNSQRGRAGPGPNAGDGAPSTKKTPLADQQGQGENSSRQPGVAVSEADQDTELGSILGARRVPAASPSRNAPTWRETTKSPLPRLALYAVPVALVLGIAAWWFFGRPGGGSFTLDSPEPLSLKAGEVKALALHVRREQLSGPIRLTFPSLPAGVAIQEAVVADGQDEASLNVITKPDAAWGEHAVTIHADAGGQQQESNWQLTVLPEHWRPDWGRVIGSEIVTDAAGKRFYQQIDVVRDDLHVRFVLIPSRNPQDDVPTCYIMQDKVWAALFQKFATGRTLKDGKWKELSEKFAEPLYPALNVHVEDADACGRWLGGRLPLVSQWDKAAGRYDKPPRPGPFVPEGDPKNPAGIAVKLDHPLKVGEATRDRSPYGCRDMSGNGLEWTRELYGDVKGHPLVPVPNPAKDDVVLLRGRQYTIPPWPLLFYELDTAPETELYVQPNPQVGFRVVLEF